MLILESRKSASKALLSCRHSNGRSRHGLFLVAILTCFAASTFVSKAQVRVLPAALPSRPSQTPALASVLAAFSRYEVVGINAGHDDKDIDDFLLALIRDPSFPSSVNDIVVECGNSLYQPVLDRYIAGEDISFTEVQKVWRNTTQPICGQSAFYEQLFPLVRVINEALPVAKRLRVLAADPPVDWSLIKDQKDFGPFTDRDSSIASIMEKEVLSKRRKALMLFGIFHLVHGSGPGAGDAVTIYEKKYPGATFVISDLGYFGTGPGDDARFSFANWQNPSLIPTRGTALESLKLDAFLPTPISTDDECNVVDPFKAGPTRVVANLIDAFLYLGPQNGRLREQMPADVALDGPYMAESLRRNAIIGLPGPSSVAEWNQQIIATASSPLMTLERLPDSKEFYPMIRQLCLDRTKHDISPIRN